MRLLLKHIFRNINENKIRGFLIIFSLAISSFVLYINFVTKDEIVDQYESLMTDIFNGYEINVVSESVDASIEKDVINKIKEHDLVTDTIPIHSEFCAYIDEDSMTAQLYSTDLKKLNDAELIETNIQELKAEEIVISHSFSSEYDYEKGDTLELVTNEGVSTYKIVDVANNYGLFTEFENVNTFVTKEKSLAETNLLLVQAKENDIGDLLTEFKEEYDDDDLAVVSAVDRTYMESNVFMLEQALIIVLIITALLNILIISSNAKAILISRRSSMGTFRSLGATSGQIAFVLSLENIIYGAIGGAAGVVLIVFGKNILMSFILQGVLGINKSANVALEPLYLLITVIFAVVVQIISVVPQIRKMANEPIKGLILGYARQEKSRFILKTVLGIALLVISLFLWNINTFYSLVYAILALLSAIAGGMLILPLITYCLSFFIEKIGQFISKVFKLATKNICTSESTANNIRLSALSITLVLLLVITTLSIQNIFSNISKYLDADYQIYGITQKEKEYDDLADVKGVKDISFASQIWDEFKVNGEKYNFILASFDKEELGVVNEIGDISKLKSGEAMIDSFYAVSMGVEIGDFLTIENTDFKSKSNKIEVKIVGTLDTKSYTAQRNVLVITPEQFKKEVRDYPSVIYVYCDQNANYEQVKRDLYTELTGENVVVQSVDDYFAHQEQSIVSIISILWVFLGLAVFVAIIGIVNNQIINFVQRKREFAVLNSIAMSKSQISLMVFFEVAISFFIGVMSGLVLSLWASKLMEKLMESLGLFVEFTFKWETIIILLLILFALLLLTALIPIRKIFNMKIINEIKYE
ncbi:MAG TPA: FtsX-like permease family protein [Clostridiaceae bacterium]|nr:FtsX-like permease family protein [Clostridiaceae bacterium]